MKVTVSTLLGINHIRREHSKVKKVYLSGLEPILCKAWAFDNILL